MQARLEGFCSRSVLLIATTVFFSALPLCSRHQYLCLRALLSRLCAAVLCSFPQKKRAEVLAPDRKAVPSPTGLFRVRHLSFSLRLVIPHSSSSPSHCSACYWTACDYVASVACSHCLPHVLKGYCRSQRRQTIHPSVPSRLDLLDGFCSLLPQNDCSNLFHPCMCPEVVFTSDHFLFSSLYYWHPPVSDYGRYRRGLG